MNKPPHKPKSLSRRAWACLLLIGLLVVAVWFIWYFDRPLDFAVNKPYQIY